jgi:hypothetical protein
LGTTAASKTFNGYYKATVMNQAVIAAEVRISSSSAPPIDFVRIESFRDTTPGKPPLMYPTREFDLKSTNVNDCLDCLYFFQGCGQDGKCEATYLAQSGKLQFTKGTEKVAGGAFTGVGRNLEFIEWDLTRDSPVVSGRCANAVELGFDASW